MAKVRTRFAPSPTGYLHIGGARTALFNWLFARHNGGKFILRIEDTDVERSMEESTEAILSGMKWLGLDWDEGPYYQSKRIQLYRDHVDTLLEKSLAYKCYCSPEELEERRQRILKAGGKPKYDGRCRERTDQPGGNQDFAIRFKSRTEGTTVINDLLRGNVIFENAELDDLIILRRDKMPTYNLSVVVDDATMGITHVIRGDDHLNNTPRQVLLYEAFGYALPLFAHIPMILGADKSRLSKRDGATAITSYREMGFLPEAMINYLARLGWSYKDQEIFSADELVEKFSFDNVGKASGVFNPEKLLWVNSTQLKEKKNESIAPLLIPFLQTMGYNVEADENLSKIVGTLKERVKTLKEMAESAEFYFKEVIEYEDKAAKKFLNKEKAPLIQSLIDGLEAAEPFSQERIQKVFEDLMTEKEIKLGALAQPVRVALTGGTVSPGIFETIEALGKEGTIVRLKKALAFTTAMADV
jgi:glutamyl-tRNA synthetase